MDSAVADILEYKFGSCSAPEPNPTEKPCKDQSWYIHWYAGMSEVPRRSEKWICKLLVPQSARTPCIHGMQGA